ncbi:radiation-inducible immediate-early gene IEX-1-like isoform X2 [Acipenser ruthenus]|uniref:radiation-inducible immediate-early gene IEX-1-like isoform X2 n=1 Tax=Acipenser ruthenus TaxID=7906 RepID=UPI002741AF35|nr:radiation-inducible immediate-early gene IEX-1-like isoform X2 [Acipenser ruthenus]
MCYGCNRKTVMSTATVSSAASGRCYPGPGIPEVFTFDPIPEPQTRHHVSRLGRNGRAIKVLYPAMTKKRLPVVEGRSTVQKLLFLLLVVICIQIYCAEESVSAVAETSQVEEARTQSKLACEEELLIGETILETPAENDVLREFAAKTERRSEILLLVSVSQYISEMKCNQ